jgi:hypothetical protein
MEKGLDEKLTFLGVLAVWPSRGIAEREAAYVRKSRRER